MVGIEGEILRYAQNDELVATATAKKTATTKGVQLAAYLYGVKVSIEVYFEFLTSGVSR